MYCSGSTILFFSLSHEFWFSCINSLSILFHASLSSVGGYLFILVFLLSLWVCVVGLGGLRRSSLWGAPWIMFELSGDIHVDVVFMLSYVIIALRKSGQFALSWLSKGVFIQGGIEISLSQWSQLVLSLGLPRLSGGIYVQQKFWLTCSGSL